MLTISDYSSFSYLQRSGIDYSIVSTGGTVSMEINEQGVRGSAGSHSGVALGQDTVIFRGFTGRLQEWIQLTSLDSSAITPNYRTLKLLRILRACENKNFLVQHGTDTTAYHQAFTNFMLPRLTSTFEQESSKAFPAIVTHVSWATPGELGSDAHINGQQARQLVVCDDLPTGSYVCVGNRVYSVNAVKQAFQPHGNDSYFIDPFERIGLLNHSPSYVGCFDEQGQFQFNPSFKKTYDNRLKNPLVQEYEVLLARHLKNVLQQNDMEVAPFSESVQNILIHPKWTPAQYEEYFNNLVKTYGKNIPNTGLILHGRPNQGIQRFKEKLKAKGFHVWHMQDNTNQLNMLPRVATAKLGILIRLFENQDASSNQATVQKFMNTDLRGEGIPLFLAEAFSYSLPSSTNPQIRWFVASGGLNQHVIQHQIKEDTPIHFIGTGNGHLPVEPKGPFYNYLKNLHNPMTMYTEVYREIPNMNAYQIGKTLLEIGIQPAKESIQPLMKKLGRFNLNVLAYKLKVFAYQLLLMLKVKVSSLFKS